MDRPGPIVVFGLEGERFALPVSVVVRVLRAAAVTPVPDPPPLFSGVLDLHGEILPVFDVRSRFGLPARETRLADRFVVVTADGRRLVVPVDEVVGVSAPEPGDLSPATGIHAGLGIEGAYRREDGVVLVWDLARFLALPSAPSPGGGAG